MASCATLFQCFDFLAANDATIGLTRNPDDPAKNRMTISIPSGDGADVAMVEYDRAEECDLASKVIGPICRALVEHYEKEVKNG
jgi:hypothetical protein